MNETKFEKLIRMLKQPTTWVGIVGLAGMFGINITPEFQSYIVQGLVSVFCIYQIFRDEDKGRELPNINRLNRDQIRQLLVKGLKAGIINVKGNK